MEELGQVSYLLNILEHVFLYVQTQQKKQKDFQKIY